MPGLPLQLGDSTVNPLLTQISVAHSQTLRQIAPLVFPTINVDTQSGIYWEYPRGQFFRTDAERRAPGAPAPRTSLHRVLKSYQCDVDAIASDIPDQLRYNQNQSSMLDLDRAHTRKVTQDITLREEMIWAQDFFKDSVWGTDITGVSSNPTPGTEVLQFDQTGSDPVDDIQKIVLDHHEGTGVMVNTAVIGARLFQTLINHSVIRELIKYSMPALPGVAITPALLAQLWGLERVFVVNTILNSDNDVSDASPATGASGMHYMHSSKSMLLTYTPPAPAIDTPAAGYTFRWRMGGTTGENGVRIKSYRDERLASTTIEAETAYGFHQVSATCGIFLKDLIG